jgi:hypothetical protein
MRVALLVLVAVAGCAPTADRSAPPATPGKAPPPPPPPAVVATDTAIAVERCVTPASCASVRLRLPRLRVAAGVASGDSAALAQVLAALEDSIRTLAGVPAGRAPAAHVDAVATRLHRDLRAHLRQSPDWGGGYLREVTARVVWASAQVLTVEVEETGFTGGAHGQYEAALRSYDVRTGAVIPVTAVVADTAALVPLLEAGFARAKADSGGAPPPLAELLYPEVKRLPVPVNAGLVETGVRFLYNPYDVASWAVGRTDVLLTWAQLGVDPRRWGG